MVTDAANSDILTASQCWGRLREAVVGRLAVVIEGDQPDIFPVNHVVDHSSVVFRTAEGAKLTHAVGRKVAFEVDGYEIATARAWSVIVKGTAHEIWAVDEAIRALDLPLTPWSSSPKPRLVRIEPTSVTGRTFVVQGGVRSSSPAE